MKKLLVGMVLVAVAGCSEKEKPFAVIDGWALTPEVVKAQVLLTAKMRELAGQQVAEGGFAKWANQTAMQMVPTLVSMRLAEQEIHRLGLTADPEDGEAVLGRYRRLVKDGQKLDVETLAPLFGECAETFRANFERDCLFSALMRKHLKAEVTEAELTRYFQTQTNIMIRAKQISANGWKKAKEAYAKLKAGEPWDKVAAAYSEDGMVEESNANNWKEWATFNPKTFWITELQEVLPKLKVGEFTEPIDAEEGLLIVKVLEIDEGLYTCVRILIRMGTTLGIPSLEEAKKELYAEKFQNLQLNFIADLKERAKIEFPMGTNFVYEIWKTAK